MRNQKKKKILIFLWSLSEVTLEIHTFSYTIIFFKSEASKSGKQFGIIVIVIILLLQQVRNLEN